MENAQAEASKYEGALQIIADGDRCVVRQSAEIHAQQPRLDSIAPLSNTIRIQGGFPCVPKEPRTLMTLRAKDLPLHYNAATILEHNLAERAQKTALFSLERNLTFDQVNQESNQVAHALQRLDVRFGETVAIFCLDQPAWVTSFFGTLKMGGVAAGLNTLMTSGELDYILRDCRARVLIIHCSLWGTFELISAEQPFLQHIIVVGNKEIETEIAYDAWIDHLPTTFETVPTHREDIATLNYSSGTTGQPKGILHAHKDLPLISEYWGKLTLGLTEHDRTFAGAKLFFTYGTGGNLLFPWYVGASVVLFSGSPRRAANLLQIVDRFKPTIFYNAPTGYAIALSMPDLESKYDLSSVRLCVSGGENLPAAIWEQWLARTGIRILNGVGCTEVYHNFISNRPDDMRPGASGTPVPGFDLKLVDPDGNIVPEGAAGNLMVRGDTVALSYLHQYERSKRTFQGEWFSTGDQFRRDADGYYWHEGRSDDMLKVGGIWVSPMEVEATLIKHPAVVECAVVGWHDADELIKPKAYVTLNTGFDPHTELADTLIAHCRATLAAYKRPRKIE
ncbi:MAG: benzoate-CoA ligase family protein, partial [Candidatus Promineifilaceae bacterium]